MSKIPVLNGHISFETAYIIKDYPYGFNLRCEKRVWIEDGGKKGYRVVSVTSNPKRPGTYNKPKKSTYSMLRFLFIDPATGYVENNALNPYCTNDAIALLNTYEFDEKNTKFIQAFIERSKKFDEHMKNNPVTFVIKEYKSTSEM